MFNRKNFFGWFLCILGACWNLLGLWARIEFVLKKIWPEKSAFPILSAIASSPWFPSLLVILGFVWIWFFSRAFSWPWGMMLLKEACKILYKELRNDPYTANYFDSLAARDSRALGEEEELNLLGMQFVGFIDIYGKKASFTNWEKIRHKEFNMGEIKDGASALYRFGDYGKQNPEFTDLAIKKSPLAGC